MDYKTSSTILTELLNFIDDSYEKNIGYPTYDILKSYALELATVYTNLQSIVDMVDVDKLTGDNLTKYVLQRKGLTRKVANKAKAVLIVKGNGAIAIGNLFETANGVQFRAIETVTIATTGTVKVEAVIAGMAGNVGANTITQMPVTIQGIVSCTNLSAAYDGYEQETDDELRNRYYEILRQPSTSGNKYHYISWAKEIVGTGDAKCIPLWNGASTVKVVIIDENKQPASADLISRVQAYIDPLDSNGNPTGDGSGVAPIGAYCTVVSATAKPINISVTVTKQANYTTTDIQTGITNAVTTYLKDIAFLTIQNFVSYAKIGSIILGVDGVADYSNLLINNGTTNIAIGTEEVATIGAVVVVS